MDSAEPTPRAYYPKELTARQRAVLDLIAKGMTNAQIGEALGISLDGAKWHVSEALTRLDVRTREEAAEYWRRERRRSAGRAVVSAARAVRPAKWLALAAAGLAAMAAVALVVAVFNDGGPDAAGDVLDDPNTAGSSPAIAEAEEVGFQLCGQTQGGWRRPTLEEMADRFANPRFGDDTRPHPGNWLLYLSRFRWGQVPLAVSANIEASAFGERIPLDPARAVTYCDPAAFTVAMRFQDLRLADHEVTGMESVDGKLVVHTKAAPGTLSWVTFPYPPVQGSATPAKNESPLFTSITIVGEDGRTLMEQKEGFRVEYNDDRTFLGGRMGIEVNLTTPAALDVDVLRECLNTAGGTLQVVDASGQSLANHDIPAGGPGWEIVATVHLEPGVSTLKFEPDTDGDACFVLLPSGSQRP